MVREIIPIDDFFDMFKRFLLTIFYGLESFLKDYSYFMQSIFTNFFFNFEKCNLKKIGCIMNYRLIGNERENVYSKILLMKSSKKHFIILPAFYLTIWLMKQSKNFEKISILKI